MPERACEYPATGEQVDAFQVVYRQNYRGVEKFQMRRDYSRYNR